MRTLIIFIVAAILIPLSFRVFTISDLKPQPTQPSAQPLPHPYSLSSLPSHVPTLNRLTVEKQLSATAAYKSYLVSYPSDNLQLFALMNIPLGPPPVGGWPVIIVNHGHITPSIYSTVSSYRNTSAYYAAQGFLVLKPDYRGHDRSEGTISPLYGHQQFAVDVLNLITGLPSLPQANPDRLFLYGHSMGADVSLMVAELSPRVKALSLWAPALTDYPQNITYFMDKHQPSETITPSFSATINAFINTYGARQFSSLANISELHAPLIIHHSPTDPIVPYAWGQHLAASLEATNHAVTFYTYPRDNHDLAGHWSQALSRDLAFFRTL